MVERLHSAMYHKCTSAELILLVVFDLVKCQQYKKSLPNIGYLAANPPKKA